MDGTGETTCEQQDMSFAVFCRTNLVFHWSRIVDTDYLERSRPNGPVCWEISGWWTVERSGTEFLAPEAIVDINFLF
jgi:hypothetical protein